MLDPSVHVTAVITHRVRPGREPGYETWIKGISVDARRFDGYLGAHILRPELGVTEDHVIVVQFDTCKNLDRWLQSETRRGWVERIKPLIREPESIKVHTGLEPWFQLPEASARPAPMRYKQALLVWLGVAIISILVAPQVNAVLASWPFLLRILVNTGITVALLTYWVMPFLTRCFKRWLFQT